MKLIRLKLENFQGIGAEFKFDGRASIYGTTLQARRLYNAVTWLLLTERAQTRRTSPQTKGANGIHYLDRAAEAEFNVGDVTSPSGRFTTKLQRSGSATEEFDGSVDYYVDGVPTKEKDFQLTSLPSAEALRK